MPGDRLSPMPVRIPQDENGGGAGMSAFGGSQPVGGFGEARPGVNFATRPGCPSGVKCVKMVSMASRMSAPPR